MQRCFLILLCLFSLCMPAPASANCMSIYFDNFYIQQNGTVVLYNGSAPVAKLDLDCIINPDSRIRLLKNYLCDSDEILVDDSSCKVISVTAP